MQIHSIDWNFHFVASDLVSKASCVQKVIRQENSTSSVRFRRLSFNPTKEKRQWRLTIAVRFFGAGDGNRTRVTSLGSLGNNHYTTPAFQRKKYTACDPGFDKNPPCFLSFSTSIFFPGRYNNFQTIAFTIFEGFICLQDIVKAKSFRNKT